MVLFSGIQDYVTQDELLSLDLCVKKNTDITDLSKEGLLKTLCTQEQFDQLSADVKSVKALLAQKGIKECSIQERKKLYDDLEIPTYFMGKIEEALGYTQQAIKYLTQAVEQTDDLAARAAVELGHLYYESKDLVKTEQAYKQAIEKNDANRSAKACIFLGNLYCVYKTDQSYGWAEVCYNNAIQYNNPEVSAEANLLLGHLYWTINRFDRAKIVYENAANSGFEEFAATARDRLAKINVSGLSGPNGSNGPILDAGEDGTTGLTGYENTGVVGPTYVYEVQKK